MVPAAPPTAYTGPVTSALVIEGGGLRGAFTAGVACELDARGATAFDDIIGASSGAPTAAYIATRQVTEGVDVWSTYIHGDQLLALGNIARGRPLMDVDRLVGVFEHTVPLDLKALDASPIRVRIAVTACQTGAPEFIRMTSGNAHALLRATMALPLVYGRTIDVDGVAYIDGGVSAPVPLDAARGADHILVVLTRPRGYRRAKGALSALLTGLTYPRHPAIGRRLAERHVHANAILDEVDRLEDAGRIDVIRPSAPLPVGRLGRDRGAIIATIEAGRAAARAYLDKRAASP
jgi:predicted patatin/cPLA2 family phospholipase